MARRLARNSPNARLTRGWMSFTRPLLPPAARILQGRPEPPVLDISTVDHANEKNSYKTTVDATLHLQPLDASQMQHVCFQLLQNRPLDSVTSVTVMFKTEHTLNGTSLYTVHNTHFLSFFFKQCMEKSRHYASILAVVVPPSSSQKNHVFKKKNLNFILPAVLLLLLLLFFTIYKKKHPIFFYFCDIKIKFYKIVQVKNLFCILVIRHINIQLITIGSIK